MSGFQGSISATNPPGGSGGQQALQNEGTGVPIFDSPNGIRSLKEVSGVEITELSGADAGTIGFRNRIAYFFVDQYGAIGDGVTDDSAAIQACVNAAGAFIDANPGAGATIYFPPSKGFRIASTITSGWNGISLRGMASGYNFFWGSIIYIDAGILGFHFTNDGSGFGHVSGGVSMFDLSINCLTANTTPAGRAVLMDGQGFTMQNCSFSQFYDTVTLTQNSSSEIFHCFFQLAVHADIFLTNTFSADQGDAMITDCTFSHTVIINQFSHIYQEGSGGTKIINCKFVGDRAVQYCIRFTLLDIEQTSDLLITNCSMERYSVAAISVEDIGSSSSFGNILISNCQMTPILSGPAASGIEIIGSAAHPMSFVVITGNLIESSQFGIRLVEADSVNLVGNLFFAITGAEVSRTSTTNVATALIGDIATVPPVNPAVPAAYVDVVIYSPTGPVAGKIPIFQ